MAIAIVVITLLVLRNEAAAIPVPKTREYRAPRKATAPIFGRDTRTKKVRCLEETTVKVADKTVTVKVAGKTVLPRQGVADLRAVERKLTLGGQNDLASIRLGVGMQVFVTSKWKDGGVDYEHTHTTAIKRLQPYLKGHLLDPNLQWKFQLQARPGQVELMDLFLNYRFSRNLRLRAGFQKIAFTQKRTSSWKTQHLLDFAVGSRYLGTERQAGVTLHNGFKKTGHQYGVGIYTGMVARPGFGTGIARISRVPRANPSTFSDKPTKLGELHPAMSAHYAFNARGIDNNSEHDWKRTGFRYSVGAAAYYDFRPMALRDFRGRLGLEGLVKLYGWSFRATGWAGFYSDASESLTDSRFGMAGATFDVGYLFTSWLGVAVRYSFVRSSDSLLEDSQENAVAMINAASDDDAKAELKKTYQDAGMVKMDSQLFFGVSVYPLGRNVKLTNELLVQPRYFDGGAHKIDMTYRFLMQAYL
ncbi:MAG: hypothetical protein CSA65_06285 [Proteobacteria bacterium]|nr:MAG: hypothetical protein CSA65_06285 [Pseudomonadota bacterium]